MKSAFFSCFLEERVLRSKKIVVTDNTLGGSKDYVGLVFLSRKKSNEDKSVVYFRSYLSVW
ncbi:hypothetical protein HMPREF1225_1173 [Streptococcus pyogenes UTSW-2]|nr:hypothetical protein HMPREF1225_1173 [Streptococcus pyogenes UTSW-2]